MTGYNELRHHGVKGQKWGVRNGPPYPIEDKVMRKGTRLNSVSSYSNSERYRKTGRWMYTYNPDDEWDNKVYKGPFSYYKIKSTGLAQFEHEYEVTQDLKMPTSKERYNEYVNLYKKNVKTFAKDLKNIQEMSKRFNMGPEIEEASFLDLKNLQTDDDYAKSYRLFNIAMENMAEFKSTRLYGEIMSKKYDAMVDDNNQGIYNDAHDPVIVFDAKKTLKTIGEARMMPASEVAQNYVDVYLDRIDKGKKMKL